MTKTAKIGRHPETIPTQTTLIIMLTTSRPYLATPLWPPTITNTIIRTPSTIIPIATPLLYTMAPP